MRLGKMGVGQSFAQELDFSLEGKGCVSQLAPYGGTLVSAALTPTAAPAPAPEPPEPKIELGIRNFSGAL